MNKRTFKYIAYDVTQHETKENSTVFRVVGNPFGGPSYLNGKDLEGQFFSKSTDFGKIGEALAVPQIFAYYDHALRDNNKDLIGVAKFFAEEDRGLVWDIEVDKRYRYHDMLVQLAEKKFLGASSQPVQTSVEIDWESGNIKRWHNAEMSLTPTPMHPEAVVEVMKSFNVEEVVIATYLKSIEVVEDAPAENTDLGAEIENLFSNDNRDEAAPDLVAMAAAITSLTEKIDAIGTRVGTVETNQVKSDTASRDILKGVLDVRNGLKTFAVNVAKELRFKVNELEEEDSLSDEERNARQMAKSYIPENAPGMVGKR